MRFGILSGIAFATLILVAAQPASAFVIDFEDVAPASGQTTETNSTNVFGGFDVFVPHGHYMDSNHPLVTGGTRPDSGTDWLLHDHADGLAPNQPVVITMTGGGVFSVFSIDVSEWDSAFTLGQTLTATGHFQGGGTIVVNFVTDEAFGFETFNFLGFTNLIQLDLIGTSASLGPCTSFAVCGSLGYDNVVVAAVAEPATFGLLLAGLAGLGFMRRRRPNA